MPPARNLEASTTGIAPEVADRTDYYVRPGFPQPKHAIDGDIQDAPTLAIVSEILDAAFVAIEHDDRTDIPARNEDDSIGRAGDMATTRQPEHHHKRTDASRHFYAAPIRLTSWR